MLSCAGAYVSGAAGSNACPAGSVRIETEAACRTAAAAAGKTFGSTSVEADYPRGCYIWTDDNKAYFNPDAVGAGAPDARLLCAAVATTGAPPRAPESGVCGAALCIACSRGTHGVLCGQRGSRSCASARLRCGRAAQRRAVHRTTAGAGCVRTGYRTGRYSWGTRRGML